MATQHLRDDAIAWRGESQSAPHQRIGQRAMLDQVQVGPGKARRVDRARGARAPQLRRLRGAEAESRRQQRGAIRSRCGQGGPAGAGRSDDQPIEVRRSAKIVRIGILDDASIGCELGHHEWARSDRMAAQRRVAA